MSEVLKIRPDVEVHRPAEPDEEVVARLEELLEMAKAGKLRSLAVAAVSVSPGDIGPGVSTTWVRGEGMVSWTLFAAVNVLRDRMSANLRGES